MDRDNNTAENIFNIANTSDNIPTLPLPPPPLRHGLLIDWGKHAEGHVAVSELRTDVCDLKIVNLDTVATTFADARGLLHISEGVVHKAIEHALSRRRPLRTLHLSHVSQDREHNSARTPMHLSSCDQLAHIIDNIHQSNQYAGRLLYWEYVCNTPGYHTKLDARNNYIDGDMRAQWPKQVRELSSQRFELNNVGTGWLSASLARSYLNKVTCESFVPDIIFCDCADPNYLLVSLLLCPVNRGYLFAMCHCGPEVNSLTMSAVYMCVSNFCRVNIFRASPSESYLQLMCEGVSGKLGSRAKKIILEFLEHMWSVDREGVNAQRASLPLLNLTQNHNILYKKLCTDVQKL